MKVIAYLRVSTEQQADWGVSLAAQRAKVEAYAALYDLEVVEVIEDAGASAKTLAREGMAKALALLDSGQAEGLLVAKLDRLTRSVRDLLMLVDRYFRDRFSLFSVSEQVDTRSAAGRMTLNLLAVISQWERETIGERTAEALQHIKAQGVRLGGEGLGWARSSERGPDGRQLVREVNEEAATVVRIHELRADGHTLREIAAALAAEGHRTKRGGQWHPTTINRVLARKAQGSTTTRFPPNRHPDGSCRAHLRTSSELAAGRRKWPQAAGAV